MRGNIINKFKVLVTPTSFKPDSSSEALAALRDFAGELVFNPTDKPLAEQRLIELLDGCDGIVAGLDIFNENVIRAGSGRLKVISRYGSGYDNVDVGAARKYGVTVCFARGANSQAVADLTFGLMICAARKIPMLDRSTKTGGWARSIGVELYGKTIGIVGLGAVGKAVAQRARGFSMRILAYDPMLDAAYANDNGIKGVPFRDLLTASDIISLHIPLNENTRHIINAETLGFVKPGAILINTARGGLLDEAAAYDALVSGRLGGLGLDAYESEPPGASPLFGLDNAILMPHTGSHTAEATANLARLSVQNLIDVLSGRPCEYTV